MSFIYSFYEHPIEIQDTVRNSFIEVTNSNQKKNSKTLGYKCKTCSNTIKCKMNVNSNLYTHINSKNHEEQRAIYDAHVNNNKVKKTSALENCLTKAIKRSRIDSDSESLSQSLLSMGAITRTEKYKANSSMQTERYMRLLYMIIKCMLPISIVDMAGFRDFIEYLDPCFKMPSRNTIKIREKPFL